MSQLPKIPGLDRITEPAVPERVFTDLKPQRLVINDVNDKYKCSVAMVPLNPDTGETGDPSKGVRVDFDNLIATAIHEAQNGDPQLLKAVEGVFAAMAAKVSDPKIKSLRNGNIIEIKEPD